MELLPTIYCTAVDRDALQDIREYVNLSKKTSRLDGMEEKAVPFDENMIQNILQHLKNRNGEDNFAFAISNVCDVWKSVNTLNKPERKQLGHGTEQSIVLQQFMGGSYPMNSVVQFIYKRLKTGWRDGPIEPDSAYLRFSAHLERLENRPLKDPIQSLALETKIPLPVIRANSKILVCNSNRSDEHLCVYITKDIAIRLNSVTWLQTSPPQRLSNKTLS